MGTFPADWKAYVGINHLAQTSDGPHLQTSDISAIIQPKAQWDDDSYARDIMLFKLKASGNSIKQSQV